MRGILMLWILLCAPMALGVLGWGLLLIYKAAGLVIFLICCAIMVTAGLGLASLLDNRQPPPNQRQRDR